MRIDQATYGLGKSGHSLLQSSGQHDVFKELERRMDLPNTAPHGIIWSPYLSGFQWREHYVLSKTELDSGATRGGVVSTHALLLPLTEIIEVDNLEPFVRLLFEATGDATGQTAEVETSERGAAPRQERPLAALVNALSSREAGPAVWVGINGFSEVIIDLWSVLWPELRRSLVFRLSFGPDDLVEKPTPNLVVTPVGLSAKWANTKVIDRSSSEIQTTPVAAAILDPEAALQLRQVKDDFGLRVTGFQDLFLVQQLLRSTEKDDFASNLSSMRIVESISESAGVGQMAKDKLLRRLVAQLPALDAAQVLLLRNLQLTKVNDFGAFWSGLTDWVAANRFPSEQDDAFLTLTRDALSEAASIQAWSGAVRSGLLMAARQSCASLSSAIWRWIVAKGNVGVNLLSFLPGDQAIQECLLKSIPATLPVAAGLSITAVCQQNGWLRLHGAVLHRAFDTQEAIHRQLVIDVDPSHSEGLLLAIGAAPDRDVVEAAITNGDERLINLAAERVAANGTSLRDADFIALPVQKIWTAAMVKANASWKVPRTPSEAAERIFDRLIDGQAVYSPLIDVIARTPLSDVSAYARRHLLWTRLSSSQMPAFLQSTVEGSVRQLGTTGSMAKFEPVLEAAALSSDYTYDGLAGLLQAQPGRIGVVADIFPSFGEVHFERLLQVLTKGPLLPIALSNSLGDLVLQRRWRKSADWMLSRALYGRDDLRPALARCAELFGWFTRLRHQLSSVSSDQKWAALREIVTVLYPSGPDHHDVWERSGGKNRELEHHGEGESRWTAALNRMRNGNGVHPGRLLHEMRQEYPVNEELRFLAEDVEFGGWRK